MLPSISEPEARWSLQGNFSNTNVPCLVRDGSVYCANEGKVEGIERAVWVDTGANFHCALDEDRQVWCWGHNDSGQLGRGTVSSSEEMFPPALVAPEVLGEVSSLSVGSFTACAVRMDGELWCWGKRLGDPQRSDATPQRKPLMSTAVRSALGWRLGCVLLQEGVVACWGETDVPQPALGSRMAISRCCLLTPDPSMAFQRDTI